MLAEQKALQLDLDHRTRRQDLRMSCRTHKHNSVTSWMKTVNTLSRHEPTISPSDRTIVLDMCTELVRVGYGILEDLPVVDSQVLYLKSGEIYWLGPHEVTRLQ